VVRPLLLVRINRFCAASIVTLDGFEPPASETVVRPQLHVPNCAIAPRFAQKLRNTCGAELTFFMKYLSKNRKFCVDAHLKLPTPRWSTLSRRGQFFLHDPNLPNRPMLRQAIGSYIATKIILPATGLIMACIIRTFKLNDIH
jgi:hypothetical protein